MRILMIYSTPNLGGAELYALNLLQVLHDEVQFTVICPENSFLSGRAKELGLSTFEVPISYPDFDTSQLIQSAYKIMDCLKDETFDLIYTHHLPAAVIGQLLRFKMGYTASTNSGFRLIYVRHTKISCVCLPAM